MRVERDQEVLIDDLSKVIVQESKEKGVLEGGANCCAWKSKDSSSII
jgi:hypothetical protein